VVFLVPLSLGLPSFHRLLETPKVPRVIDAFLLGSNSSGKHLLFKEQ
jgi:hypothetical protein